MTCVSAHEVTNNLAALIRIGNSSLSDGRHRCLCTALRISQIKHVSFERESKPVKAHNTQVTANMFQVVCERFHQERRTILGYSKFTTKPGV